MDCRFRGGLAQCLYHPPPGVGLILVAAKLNLLQRLHPGDSIEHAADLRL